MPWPAAAREAWLGGAAPPAATDNADADGGDGEEENEAEGSPYLNIVVEGCCHGKMDEIYAGLKEIERPANEAPAIDDELALRRRARVDHANA